MSDITPARVVSIVDAIQAPVGRSYAEIRTTLRFLNTTDRDSFVGSLGLGTPTTLGWTAITAKPALEQMLAGITAPTGGASGLDGVNVSGAGFATGQIVWFTDGSLVWRYLLADVGSLPTAVDPDTVRPATAFGTRYWQLLSMQSISGTAGGGARVTIFQNQTVQAEFFVGNGSTLTALSAPQLTGAMPSAVTIDAARLTSGIIPPDRSGVLSGLPDSNYSFSTASFAGGAGGFYTTALTAARSYNLPPVANYPAGSFLRVYDSANAVTSALTVTMLRDGTDTINGGTSITLSSTSGVIVLKSLGSGKWQGWVEQFVASPANGGTGVANAAANTLTLAGTLQTIGANALIVRTSGATDITLPTSGTILTSTWTGSSSLVTLGTITSGVWQGTPINLASYVTGLLPTAKGGTALDGSSAAQGALLIGTGTGYALAQITGTTNQITVTPGVGSITLAVAVGTTANKIVQLDGSAQLPAVSGVNLTLLNASNLGSGNVAAARMPALTGDISSSVGTVVTALSATGIAAGNFGLLTVDTKGRSSAGKKIVQICLTSDVTVASTSFANITGMNWGHSPSEVWAFEALLMIVGAANGGKFQMSGGSSGATYRLAAVGSTTGVTVFDQDQVTAIITAFSPAFAQTAGSHTVTLQGMVNGGSGGTPQLQFSTASGTNTITIKAGSTFIARQF